MDLNQLSEKSLEFSLVSRAFTRKAQSIGKRPQVTIAFHDPRLSGENGYCALTGTAQEVVDESERAAVWKSSWSFFHPQGASEVVVWRFSPKRVEVISHSHGVSDDWRPVTMQRRQGDGTPPATSAMWELLRRQRD